MARKITPRKRSGWFPIMGAHATYRKRGGQHRIVRVVAEASGGRMMVETVNADGKPQRVTVKIESLGPMEPELFE
jgi:hypothetical protein